MKFSFVSALVALSTVSAGSIFTMNVKDKMSSDFLTGFESGIFLRDQQKQFEEYGCPGEDVDSADLAAFKAGIAPIKSMATLVGGGDPNSKQAILINEIIDSVETFVSSFDKFIGVFDDDYAGGDFCAGITFGMYGT